NPGDGVGTAIGDITLDGHVDSVDLGQMVAGFGAAGGWSDGNLNVDTLVDGTDLALLKANFGADVGGAADTPEPATLAILAVGAVGMLRRRR
ncbi:MAG: PEP-CTERM sorting domain-containing protein, partial [Planctomycetota bacterium]